jgi:DinB superfamily
MSPNPAPPSLPALLDDLSAAEREVAGFFGALSPEELVTRVGDAWSPAEHLAHLNIAVTMTGRGFSMPREELVSRFGEREGGSKPAEEIREAYAAALAGGGKATGRFVPEPVDAAPGESGPVRQELLSRWAEVNEALRAALSRWSEEDIDRLQLPHPLLGNLTLREIGGFAALHARHHVTGAKKRL